jgi:hypothetical protein
MKTLHLINILAYGLYAGFLLSVAFIEATLRSVPASTYVIVEQVKHTNLNLLAMILIFIIIIASLSLLILSRTRRSVFF